MNEPQQTWRDRYGCIHSGPKDMDCPKCGEPCNRDEVDVGVGVIYGPWGCYSCGWSESSEYDRSEGTSAAQQESPSFYVDPCGGKQRLSAIEDKLNHFGIDGKSIVDEVFRGPQERE